MRDVTRLLSIMLFLSCIGRATHGFESDGMLNMPPSRTLVIQQKELIESIRSGDSKGFDRLLGTGLNPNYLFGEAHVSPLSEAIAERQPKMIASLLSHGADVNFGVNVGLVPLAVAAWYDDADTVTELLKRGAIIDARDSDGYTPLLEAASHAEGVRVIKLLVAAGANIQNTGNIEGDTVLMLAASRGNLDAVSLFVQLGVSACIGDKHGMMASNYVNALVKPETGKTIRDLLNSKCVSTVRK